MSIVLDLTEQQQAWLAAQVASGEFPSMEAAAQQIIAERIAASAADLAEDDLAWAKPLVDKSVAQFQRGEFVTQEDFDAIIDAHLASLQV